jgi:hypothetical protein
MSEHEKVVDLVSAGVPADQGLSALGLVMQVSGSVMAAYAGLVGFVMLFSLGGGGDRTIWALLIVGLCVARSMFHRAAGTELLYGRTGLQDPEHPSDPLLGVKRYVLVGLAQSVVLAGVLALKLELPAMVAIGFAAGLATWPAVLMVLMALPRFKRFSTSSGPVPSSEDKGFEGASILMTIFGACGVLATGTVLAMLLRMPGRMLQQGPVVLLLVMLGVLVIRSFIHVQAGVSGLRETSIDRSVDLANRYANFGVVSSFCVAGAMLLIAMTTHFDVSGLAVVSGLCWMLMSWPLIIRRFYSERQFSDLLAGDHAPIHRRAPDAGLTALGWLLIAMAALSASLVIPQLLMGAGGHDAHSDFGEVLSVVSGAGDHSPWFSLGAAVLQLWAGVELVRMSPQARTIANVFGVISGAVAVYMMWPILSSLRGGDLFDSGPTGGVMFGVIATTLVVPVATLILVNRTISPTARARFRTKASQTPPAE